VRRETGKESKVKVPHSETERVALSPSHALGDPDMDSTEVRVHGRISLGPL
jgi:hypothetical protein